MKTVLTALPVFVGFALIGWLGGAAALGAHPFWALKVCLIGGGIGVVMGAVLHGIIIALRGGTIWAASFGLIVLLAAGWTSRVGAARFAISYAEDAFGGKMWFFGAIGAAAGLAILAYVLLAAVLMRAMHR
jgi:hypothetical protein